MMSALVGVKMNSYFALIIAFSIGALSVLIASRQLDTIARKQFLYHGGGMVLAFAIISTWQVVVFNNHGILVMCLAIWIGWCISFIWKQVSHKPT